MSAEFVLVHGAGHGAWCWDAVIPLLERRGHRAIALDLPGHGRRAAEARHATVGSYARTVADAMARAGISRGIVVGHSMGGMVIPKVAELVPARVRHLVFLAAIVIEHGQTLAATARPGASGLAALRGWAAARGGGAFLFPAEFAWARWMQDLDRGHPATSAALARITPQPLAPWLEPVSMRRFHALRLPRTYIRCLKDQAVLPERAAAFAARLGVEPVDLDTAHDPMLSAPKLLADALDRIARSGAG
jgi:pimeloyl-ACP methyl ester carboxylesterase